MAKALQRILRIRQLAEEQARLEVERAAQRARQVSAACAQQSTLEQQQRFTLAASWASKPHDELSVQGSSATTKVDAGEVVQEKGWLMEEAVLEFFGWRRMRLEQLREVELARMEPLVAIYTERRRELRQTEQLLEQQAAREVIQKNRRAQAETDEWFSQRNRMPKRQELRRTSPVQGQDPTRDDG
ncbi:MAG: hypothetical protein V4587_08515 [Acidobacteriota bacterium]